MATPQQALGDCDIPMNAVINIDAQGNVLGRSHRFIFDKGTIQFISQYSSPMVATFTPVGVFGDPQTGQVSIPADSSTSQISADGENICVNFQVTAAGLPASPLFSVSVGCAPLTIVVDGDGGLDIEDSTIPNGGAITFVGGDDIPSGGVTLTMTSSDPAKTNPFGPPITLKKGDRRTLHAVHTDLVVNIAATDARIETGGTVKIGSGGGGPN